MEESTKYIDALKGDYFTPVQEDTQAARLGYQYIFNECIYYLLPIDKC